MYEIAIDSERLKHFPKTVPMNIREAVLIAAQALSRFLKAKAAIENMHAGNGGNEEKEGVSTASSKKSIA